VHRSVYHLGKSEAAEEGTRSVKGKGTRDKGKEIRLNRNIGFQDFTLILNLYPLFFYPPSFDLCGETEAMPEIHVIEATKELNILRSMKDYRPPFEVIGNYRLIDDGERPEATVILRAGDQEMHEADIGVGPVDALANVLKKSLRRLFPDLISIRLMDFEVHLIQGTIGTSAHVTVDIVFSDGRQVWRVSSTDDNINLASFKALLDGYEYAIYLWGKGGSKIQGPGFKGKAKAGSKTKPKTTNRSGSQMEKRINPESKPKSN
jgi:hypothetical protein